MNDECLEDGSNHLFKVQAVGTPQSLIRRVRENWVIAPTYFILAVSSLVVWILTVFKKERRCFNLLTQFLIFGASSVLFSATIKSLVDKKDEVIIFATISA